MQHFSKLVSHAKHINALNTQLQGILPAQLKDVKVVKIDQGVALLLVDNAAMLQLAMASDMLSYITACAGSDIKVVAVEYEVRRL